jgi:hypothetical protein
MIYEASVTYRGKDEKGRDKGIKKSVLCENYETFGEVETKLMDEYSSCEDIDVVAIKRSKIKEIANARKTQDDCIYIAEISDTFLNDDGSEKEICYQIAFFSMNFDTAKMFITEYSKQGYDMELISLKKSNFLDVVK